MATDRRRRRLLATAAAMALMPPLHVLAGLPHLRSILLGAWNRGDQHFVGTWGDDIPSRSVEIPFRAHQVIMDSARPHSVIAIARRPGEFLARIDLRSAQLSVLQPIDPEFVTNGHAALDSESRLLLVAESDVVTGQGAIGIYEAQSLVNLGRLPTFGIGPHALLLEPAGSLLIANGGTLTLPETGRTKLNLGGIDSSLVRLGPDGMRLGQWRLGDPNLSIRHLAYANPELIGVGLQADHRDAEDRARAPVFALFNGRTLDCVDPAEIPLGGYAGDIACIETAAGSVFAVACTRAGLVAIWDGAGHYLGAFPLARPCALATIERGFIAPSEKGEVGMLTFGAQHEWNVFTGAPAWDNHVVIYHA